MQSIANGNILLSVQKIYQRMGGGGKDRPHIYEDTTLLNHLLLNVMNPELLTNHREDLKSLSPYQSLLHQDQSHGSSCCTSSMDQGL